jgi:predicted HAD superfamily phosphohydrolase YqeG
LDAGFDRFGPQIHDKVQTFGPRNMGMFKQDKRFFPYIAETLGIAHEPILVVGDKGRRDIVGAHHARLFSMLVSPLGDKDLWFDALGLRKLDDLALRIGSNAVRRRLVLAV